MNKNYKFSQTYNFVKKVNKLITRPLSSIKINTSFVQIVLLGFISFNLHASPSLIEEINDTQLIIKAKLIKKHTEYETGPQHYIDYTGEVIRTIIEKTLMTTFVFSVDEVLKGKHDEKTIIVKMDGGCDTSNHCESFPWNYNYEINEEGVLFLRHKYKNEQLYIAPEASYSVFAIGENDSLIRKSTINKNKELKINKKQNSVYTDKEGKAQILNVLTLDKLKYSIIKSKGSKLK